MDDLKKDDIIKSGLLDMHHSDLDTSVESYNSIMMQMLDKNAFLKCQNVTVHADAPWRTDSIKEIKCEERKVECKLWQTGLSIHKEIYMDLRNRINHMISAS